MTDIMLSWKELIRKMRNNDNKGRQIANVTDMAELCQAGGKKTDDYFLKNLFIFE